MIWLAFLCAALVLSVIRGDLQEILFNLAMVCWVGERFLTNFFPSKGFTAMVMTNYLTNAYKRTDFKIKLIVTFNGDETPEGTTTAIEAAPAASDLDDETK